MMTLTMTLTNEQAQDLLGIEKELKKVLLRGMVAEVTKPETTRYYTLMSKLCAPVRAHLFAISGRRGSR